ncbi:MAG TPA: DUF4364 domain-containing protein [Thermoplasmatales archaeon]|nr:DUF4364 domain-containing protein [Thermoplasmatales archaeon]HEX17227.1 DUF4364 domain-containing protein [Thermoplasmatales archaeon]
MGGVRLINSRRSEFEILADILRLAKDGAKKTQIMYQVNLSYSQLRNYLSFLRNRGFLDEIGEEQGRIYRISEKGLKLLENIDSVLSCLR